MSELTELTEDPEVVEGNAEADRWTNYGKDRVYLNDNDFSGKYDAYIDLESGEFVCDHSRDFRMEIEDGTATITKHWVGSGEEHSEVVVVVELFETENDDEAEDSDDEESDSSQGEGDDRPSAVVSPADVHEDYEWLYEGRRFHSYHFDHDRFGGAHTLGVKQGAGPGILWHQVTVSARDDGTYDARCSCLAFEERGECSHTHAAVAKREHTYDWEEDNEHSESGVVEA